MNRTIIIASLCAVCCLFATRTHAQQPVNPMYVDSWVFNGGAGLGVIYDVDADLPAGFAFKAALQRGFWEFGEGAFALGLETGMIFNSILTQKNFTNRFTKFYIAPRAGWHYGWDAPGLDTYAGIAMGAGFLSQTNVNTRLRFYGSFYVGASYFFNENLGVNIEAGLGATTIQAGIAYKFDNKF
jgi:hypothetical protein